MTGSQLHNPLDDRRSRNGKAVATAFEDRLPARAAQPVVYALRDVEVCIATREVRLAGIPRKIEPKAFNALVYLLENRHRVVCRDELLGAIWGRTTVSESVVARIVTKVRTAICDTHASAPLIRTMHRIGYRYAGTVQERISGCASGCAEDRPGATANYGVLPLAILPFDNLTGRPELGWLELGLMSQVKTAVAVDQRLRVVSISSVLAAIEGSESDDLEQRVLATRKMLDIDFVFHVAVASAHGGYDIRSSVHGRGARRDLPVMRCDDLTELAPHLAAAMQVALLLDA